MGKTYCNYHPTKPAMWYCSSCEICFCSECITKRDIDGGLNKKGAVYLCPKCSSLAEKMAVQNIVEPFWNRLPQIFLYPFTVTSVVFILIIAGLMSLFSAPGILSIILLLFIFSIFLKYCFTVLKNTAQGEMSPPEIDENIITVDLTLTLKYWGLFILYGALGGFLFAFSMRFAMSATPAAGIIMFFICLIILLLVFPASLIVLAVNESLLDAINPMVTVSMITRIGSSYFIMYFFLVTLLAAPGILGYFIQPVVPAILFAFVASLVNCYYTIVAHHLMGYLILQHHEDIGYDVAMQEESISRVSHHAASGNGNSHLMNQLNVLIKEGKHNDAISMIQAETQGNIKTLELAERYYNLLKISQKIPEMLEHAKSYLNLLVRAQKNDAMRMVYLECVAADPKFNPQTAILFKVAHSLSDTGNYSSALAAYNRFIQGCPEDPMVPKAYLMAATLFHEKMGDKDMAIKTLKRLIKLFPNSEITPYAEKHLREIG